MVITVGDSTLFGALIWEAVGVQLRRAGVAGAPEVFAAWIEGQGYMVSAGTFAVCGRDYDGLCFRVVCTHPAPSGGARDVITAAVSAVVCWPLMPAAGVDTILGWSAMAVTTAQVETTLGNLSLMLPERAGLVAILRAHLRGEPAPYHGYVESLAPPPAPFDPYDFATECLTRR